jgi:hypothetical protein
VIGAYFSSSENQSKKTNADIVSGKLTETVKTKWMKNR